MSVIVGLAEYLGKGSADIFLFVAKVVHIYIEIHKDVFIMICSLVRVLLRWKFWVCSLLCHHWSSCCTQEEDKKGVTRSFWAIHLQHLAQWTMFCTLKRQLSATSNISRRFDTIRKYFLAFTPLLSRWMRSIPLVPLNSSLCSEAEWDMSEHS